MALVAQRGISIILPAYNEEDNIAKAVEQAVLCVKALFQDWEIIVVDDGSPFGCRMAGLAVWAIAPRVLVLQAVTRATRGGQALVALAGVALGAGDLLVGGHQREPRLAVVEGLHAPPGLLAVTAFAFFAQPAFVGAD